MPLRRCAAQPLEPGTGILSSTIAPADRRAYWSFVHQIPSAVTDPASSQSPKRNWPLIGVSVILGLSVLGVVLGAIALWVTNFNLLEWME